MNVEIARLSNGLRVVTEAMPGLQSASVGIWVSVGGRHEQAEENGIAHFLEHMAFKGTATRNALQIAEAIEDVGGYINAYTSRETTAYYARVLGADVPLALELIADILRAPIFAPEDIETERGVILQEIGQALDTPDDVIFDWLQEVSYPGQPIGRTILGPAERVRKFTRDDLVRFVTRHYGPERLIVAAAGAVDHAAIVAQVEALFSDMAAQAPVAETPAQFIGGTRRVIKDLEQAHMALALEGPALGDADFYAGQVYASALGGGMSSRLFQRVREERGLCYTIFAQAGAHADTGGLTLYAGTSHEQIAELMDVTGGELKRIVDDLSEAEVARARVQLKAGLMMGLESPSARCERLARLMQIWDRVAPLEETVARIDAVELADVRALAARFAAAPKRALALYGPVANADEQWLSKEAVAV